MNMENKIAEFDNYDIFQADMNNLYEISEFTVRQNYDHHQKFYDKRKMENDVMSVYSEEQYLYDSDSHIYIARNHKYEILGCIRSFHWDRRKVLPMEKIFHINPLTSIHQELKYNYWHVGRFAVDSFRSLSTIVLFKRLMVLAVRPIIEDEYSYMIAEIDSRLLRIMNELGFKTNRMGKSVFYLTSETVPVFSNKEGIRGFYSKYGNLC
jgi:N-acyl-L-homoserine lactone synthetase